MRQPQILPASVYWLIGAISVFWGCNWPIMKIVLREFPPLTFRAWCLGAAALVLFAMVRGLRLKIAVPRARWGHLLLISLFNLAVWNILAIYAIGMMDSGRAAIVGYTMPVWAMLLGFWLLKEPVTPRKLAGLALGCLGMLLLLGGEVAALGRAPLGALLMLGAALAWAVGIIMIRRWPLDLPLLSFSAWQMAIAFPLLLGGAIVFEPDAPSPLELGAAPLAGLAYNIAFAFVFCNWAWMRIATAAPVSVSSLSTLLVPVIGVFSSMVILGEQPGWTDFAALALVISALATVLVTGRARV